MSLLYWFTRLARSTRPPQRRDRRALTFQPMVEFLEDRSVPSTLTVTTAADSLAAPPGSLRALLASAHNGDTIDFASSLAGQTITLQGNLAISHDVDITAGGVAGIVISGSNLVTVFTVNSGVTATIDELTISNGLSPQQGASVPSQGGGIRNFGTLTITGCTIAYNKAAGGGSDGGGGIANFGTLNVSNSTIADNTLGPSASANGNAGAGILNDGTLTLLNCTVTDNDATPGNGSGGGLDVEGPTTVLNSILTGNQGINLNNYSGQPLTKTANDILGNTQYTNGYSYPAPTASLDPAGLRNNGGPTPTIAEMVGSISIAAGNPAFDSNLPYDQRGPGFPRVVGGEVDIGAFQTPTPPIYFAVGSSGGLFETTVSIYNSGGNLLGTFQPWGQGFAGGARVTTGDVNGDGIPDLIVGSGPGGITAVLVYDGKSVLANPDAPTLIAAFFPYGPHFSGGVFVAAGNLDGGSSDEIITGADSGGGPQVNIYSAAQIQAGQFSSPTTAFYAYAPNFTGGVRVATGDLNGDGKDDLITAAGQGGGPQINVYLGRADGSFISGLALAFDAFVPSFRGGAYVTAAGRQRRREGRSLRRGQQWFHTGQSLQRRRALRSSPGPVAVDRLLRSLRLPGRWTRARLRRERRHDRGTAQRQYVRAGPANRRRPHRL